MSGDPKDHGGDSSSGGSWLLEDVVNDAIDTAAEIADASMGLDTKK